MLHCKSTLEATKGDLDKAVERLRLEGVTKAETRSSRRTSEGIIASYIHHNGKIAVQVQDDWATIRSHSLDDGVAELAGEVEAPDGEGLSLRAVGPGRSGRRGTGAGRIGGVDSSIRARIPVPDLPKSSA